MVSQIGDTVRRKYKVMNLHHPTQYILGYSIRLYAARTVHVASILGRRVTVSVGRTVSLVFYRVLQWHENALCEYIINIYM